MLLRVKTPAAKWPSLRPHCKSTEMKNQIKWLDENQFELNSIQFRIDQSLKDRQKSDNEVFTIVKNKQFLDVYQGLVGRRPFKACVELGIFQGGSVIFLQNLFDLEKIIAFDISPDRIPSLDTYIRRHNYDDVFSLHFDVNQANAKYINSVLEKEGYNNSLDLVVDDASHQYAHTYKSFNCLFPHLKPGGLYIIEDWAWIHNKKYTDNMAADHPWRGKPPLSNLILQLVMSLGSGDTIRSITMHRFMVIIEKGEAIVDNYYNLEKKIYLPEGYEVGLIKV